jgi:hypothetical protein
VTRASPATANRWVSERRAKGDVPVIVRSADRGETLRGGAWSGRQPEASSTPQIVRGSRLVPYEPISTNMADLSNLLGAVYGENASSAPSAEDRDPDGPPTPVEKPAAERAPLADDLAAALSEALVAEEAAAGGVADDDGDDDSEDPHHFGPELSPERAAAVELMHASRPDSEPLGPPVGDVEPIELDDLPDVDDERWAPPQPVAAPVATPVPASVPEDSPAAPAFAPAAGYPRWDRSEDDILPAKAAGKKFFSLSLRRG